MEQFISNSNAMLIQGMTERSLESMISRLLDEKLATIIESTPKVPIMDCIDAKKRQLSCVFLLLL